MSKIEEETDYQKWFKKLNPTHQQLVQNIEFSEFYVRNLKPYQREEYNSIEFAKSTFEFYLAEYPIEEMHSFAIVAYDFLNSSDESWDYVDSANVKLFKQELLRLFKDLGHLQVIK